jgi:hypothetical protein
MSWAKSNTTKHTCGGPVFGQKTPGCPRCDELLAGAAPVQWTHRETARQADARRAAEWDAHFASERHRTQCRPCCTFGDW